MKDKIILAIDHNPVNSCYSAGAGLYSILSGENESNIPLIILNNIFLFIKPSGVPKLPILAKAGILSAITHFNQKEITHIDTFICEKINKSLFVFTLLDHYYITCSDKFLKRHYAHDLCLIYGYNLEQRYFYASDNFHNGKHAHFKIPFDELKNSQENIKIKDGKTSLITFNSRYVNNSVDDFKSKIYNVINDYLISDCQNTLQMNDSFIADNVFGFHPAKTSLCDEREQCIFGMNVYTEMLRRVTYYHEKNIDIRPFHLLWNHKEVVQLLLNYLIRNQKLNELKQLIPLSEIIVQYAFLNRQMAIKYNITSNSSLLTKIANNLVKMKDAEQTLLDSIIKRLC